MRSKIFWSLVSVAVIALLTASIISPISADSKSQPYDVRNTGSQAAAPTTPPPTTTTTTTAPPTTTTTTPTPTPIPLALSVSVVGSIAVIAVIGVLHLLHLTPFRKKSFRKK